MLQKHRILPGHMGGTYTPENVVLLSIPEHAEAHRVLWEQYGKLEDKLAWKGLLGLIGKEEILRLVPRFRGHHHTEESKQKTSRALLGRKRSLEARENMSRGMRGVKHPNAVGHAPYYRKIAKQPFATCHPNRKYYALGFCCACYQTQNKLKRIVNATV